MEELLEKYKDKGFKLTPQRLAILEYLDGNTAHPTAEEIYNEIRKKHPTISFATVYNTIQALRERGWVIEITIDPERKRFDPNATPHHHIICTECSKVSDVFVDYSGVLELPDDVHRDFDVTGNHVDFYGICTECKSKQEKNREDC